MDVEVIEIQSSSKSEYSEPDEVVVSQVDNGAENRPLFLNETFSSDSRIMSRAVVIEIQSSSTNESIELDQNEFFVESNQTNSRMLSFPIETSSEYNSSPEAENIDPNESIDTTPDNIGVRSIAGVDVNRISCGNCIFYGKMHQQAKIYYSAGALKLDQAKKLNRTFTRKRNQAKKFFDAGNRKLSRASENENGVSGARMSAIRARDALKEMKNC